MPVYDPYGNIFLPKDGIAMGSVLGPNFSNFYTSALENKVFNTINKSNIYLRYADDILLFTNNNYEINIIQDTFQNNFVLHFTQEININNKISFRGVLIDTSTCYLHWCISYFDILAGSEVNMQQNNKSCCHNHH